MKNMKHKLSFAGIWALFVAVLMPFQAKAIVLLPPCTKTGDCGISDILVVFINGAEFLLGISGAVALLFFIYGGFTMLISAGKPDQVQKGKTILQNAIIGIAIIFTSGIIVRFTTNALTGGVSEIPTIGESCNPGTQKSVAGKADGLWLSIPAGVDQTDKTKVVPEGLKCIAKETTKTIGDPCKDLNKVLEARGRGEVYACLDVSGDVKTCVRGLCSGLPSNIACCIAK